MENRNEPKVIDDQIDNYLFNLTLEDLMENDMFQINTGDIFDNIEIRDIE